MKDAIDIHNLTYSYGDTPVLNDLTFSVPAGSFFVIIGPNGSGKTTLLKVLSRIIRPGNGDVKIMDRIITGFTRKELARIIGFVPQMVPVDFPFTVIQVVLMGRSPHLGMLGLEGKEDIETAREALSFTGVAHLADRKLDQLSGGERQRVFIARAICQQPKIMLLDEPTASLDLAHQIRVMDIMEKLREEKDVTVIMVSHDVNLAAMYGDRLLLLKSGRIMSIGAPGKVLKYPILEETYGCRLLVDKSPMGDFPRITLMSQKHTR